MSRKRIYTEEQKEKNNERAKQWYRDNPEKVKERVKKWEKDNPEKVKEYSKKYRENNREKRKESVAKNYRKTKETNPIKHRAKILLDNYRHQDKIHNRGKGDLTVDWVIEQIQKGCTYKDQCGTTDWRKIGLNRKDNSLPHTKANCEPCCKKCNDRLHSEENKIPVYQYTLDGLLVGIWKSASDVENELGYSQSLIQRICSGNGKSAYGYIWSYNEK